LQIADALLSTKIEALDSALETPIRILHAGALEIQGQDPIYADLARYGVCEVVGVDPCEDDERRGESIRTGRFTQYSDATLGDGRERIFHVCRLKSRSSLYEPNHVLAALFSEFDEGSEVMERRLVRTVRLDDLVSEEFDLVVLDLQGGELLAIDGGRATIGNALIVHTEVEVVEQYVGQPLWGDVDRALQGLGFVLHTVYSYGSRPMYPFSGNDARLTGLKQWLWADVVYVRDLLTIDGLSRSRLVKLGVLLHSLYQSYDLVHHILAAADPRLAAEYLAALGPS
jgi:hypothetical protein